MAGHRFSWMARRSQHRTCARPTSQTFRGGIEATLEDCAQLPTSARLAPPPKPGGHDDFRTISERQQHAGSRSDAYS